MSTSPSDGGRAPADPWAAPPDPVEEILEGMGEAFFALDAEFRFTRLNSAAERALGRSREELAGRSIFDAFPALASTTFYADLHRAMLVREEVAAEETFDPPQGPRFRARVRPASSGGLHVFFHDVTAELRMEAERAAAEEALRQAEERYRSFVMQSSEGIWRFELKVPVDVTLPPDEQIDAFYADAVLAECNDAMARMYGHDRAEEVVGSRLGTFLPGNDERNIAFLRRFIASGYRLLDAETHEVDREGREKVFANNLVGVVREGKLLRAWGTQRDVTERVALEAERRRLLAEAEAAQAAAEAARVQAEAALAQAEGASRVKDEFLAVISHELRTPLNAILGWAQLLRSGAGLPEAEVAEGLAAIQRNAQAQTELVNDLLDLGRVMSGRLRIEPRPTTLGPVLRAAVETVSPAAAEKQVRLEMDTADVGDVVLEADPARLQQVFWNLLSNAVKFTPTGGLVEVRARRVGQVPAPHGGPGETGGGSVEVVVRDTGSGIDPEFLPHLFHRFSQAEAGTTRRHGGLGLGLAIVKSLVELHGGQVRAESSGPGQGAAFIVTLPVTA